MINLLVNDLHSRLIPEFTFFFILVQIKKTTEVKRVSMKPNLCVLEETESQSM